MKTFEQKLREWIEKKEEAYVENFERDYYSAIKELKVEFLCTK